MGWLTVLQARLRAIGSNSSSTDGMEQLAVVRPYQVPMIEQALRDHGIPCRVVEHLHHGTWEQMSTIMVAESDAPLALNVLHDFQYG